MNSSETFLPLKPNSLYKYKNEEIYKLISITAISKEKIIKHWFKENETITETRINVVVEYHGFRCSGAKVIEFEDFVKNSKEIKE